MSSVGKKIPDISVNAMNEMGDTISVNILKNLKLRKVRFYYFGTPKISLLFALQNCMRFRRH